MNKYLSDTEVQRAVADSQWWKDFGAQFGWVLYGFTFRESASFRGTDNRIFEVTRYMRDSIQGGIEAAKGQTP